MKMISQGELIVDAIHQMKLISSQSMLTGGLITIYVGPKRKEYQVHRGLLASIDYWSKVLDSKLAEDSQIMHLPNQRSESWDLFVNWLYRGSLKDISVEKGDVAENQARQYISLYIRAERWAIPTLQNKIMDKLHAWTTPSCYWFASYSILHVYEQTPKGSPLRSYLVDSFLAKSSWLEANTENGGWAARLKSQLDYGNQGFVLECMEALMQLTPKLKLRAPDRKSACTYHKHEDGKKCCK